MNSRLFTFVGGSTGEWSVILSRAVIGEPLPFASHVSILSSTVPVLPQPTGWILRGVTSNERYVSRPEKDQLLSKQSTLGRPEATHSALIPIRKNTKWWTLTQDERREIFEERSNHTKIGLRYLPNIARRLHHCRDLSTSEPFDFLTLFDYAREDAAAFEDLVGELRTTEEWKFVEREVDIRLVWTSDTKRVA